MARMQFGLTAFERARGDLPQLPVVNMFAEEAPTEETGVVLQSRPPLEDRSADMGSGPIEALFKRDGVLDGDLYGVSGGALYRESTSLGSISGSGAVSMAGNEAGLVVTAGSTARYLDTLGVLSNISFPDGADVRHVANGASRFWMIRADTGKLYFTPALEATVDALDFVTAESFPDSLLHMLWIDDTAILFGSESVEFWPNTGDPDLPIQPLEGRVFEKGIRATGCATQFGATFAWVTNGSQVCISDPDNIVSNPGLEEKIAASTACRLWTFQIDGDEFLALTIDDATYCRGQRSGLWHEMQSYGESNWLVQCHAGGVFGGTDGATYAFGTGPLDAGTVFERRFRSGFPLNSGGLTVNSIQLRCNVGQTTYLTGVYADPTIEMRLSRDAGKTWGNWRTRSLGEQGRYRSKVIWRGCGMASQPGLLAEFRLTDPVDLRISDVLVNEPWGGR